MAKSMVRLGYGSVTVHEHSEEHHNSKRAAHVHDLQVVIPGYTVINMDSNIIVIL